jgi:hypothetical protein
MIPMSLTIIFMPQRLHLHILLSNSLRDHTYSSTINSGTDFIHIYKLTSKTSETDEHVGLLTFFGIITPAGGRQMCRCVGGNL